MKIYLISNSKKENKELERVYKHIKKSVDKLDNIRFEFNLKYKMRFSPLVR